MSEVELNALREVMHSGDDVRPAVAACFNAFQALPSVEKGAILRELDELIASHRLDRIGPVALLAGALLESGASPQQFPPAIFDRLVDRFEAVAGLPETADPDPLAEAVEGLERAAIAYLALSPELRRGLPQGERLRSLLKRYADRYGFVGKMLLVLDDEPLLVLHAPTERAWRVRIRGVADNFQLHLLLLGAFAGDGPGKIRGQAPSAAAVAAGSDGPMGEESVVSDWQLANWFALRSGGRIADEDKERGWIWNEGVPADIEKLGDLRIVLIGESPVIRRTWNAGRIFPPMAGSLVVERALPPDEVRELMDRLRAGIPNFDAPLPVKQEASRSVPRWGGALAAVVGSALALILARACSA